MYVDDVALAWERYLSIGGFSRAVADALGHVDVQPGTANGLWNVLWRSERRTLDERYGRGIVATRDVLDMADNVWAVPTGLLAWIIEA